MNRPGQTKSWIRQEQILLPGIAGSYGSAAKTRYDVVNVQATGMSEASINKLNHLLIGGSSGF